MSDICNKSSKSPLSRSQAEHLLANMAEEPWNTKPSIIKSLVIYVTQTKDHDFDAKGGPLLHTACKTGSLSFIEVCLKRPKYPQQIQHLHAALELAMTHITEKETELKAIHLLVRAGASVNDRFTDGNTPLITALEQSRSDYDLSVPDLLLTLGANPSASTMSGTTPLMMAAQLDFPNFIVRLLAVGVDTNALDKNGNTALHYADNSEIIKMLLENGAQVHFINDQNESALCRVLYDGEPVHHSSPSLLLQAGSHADGIDWSSPAIGEHFIAAFEEVEAHLKPAQRVQCLITAFAHGQSISPWAAKKLADLSPDHKPD